MATPEKDFERLEKRFFDEWVHRNPLLATSLGLHSPYDELMPDGSPAKELDDLRFLKRSLAEFEQFTRKLPPARQVDRDLAIHTLTLWIYEREELRWSELYPEAPQIVGRALFQVLARNYAPLKERLRSIMKRLERTPAYIKEARLKLKTPVRQFMESELETLSRLPGFFNMLKDVAREQLLPTPERQLGRLIEDVQTALDEYENWLIVDAKPFYRDSWFIGEEKLRRLLQLRGIDAALPTLASEAEAEMGRLREKLREIGHGIKRKAMVEDVREMVRQQHPDNFDGVLRYVRESVQRAKQFTSRSGFAPMPDHDVLYVTETPSFLSHLLPWATYLPPARFEPKHEGYFFVTPGDCDSDKLKEHNFAALSNLTVHEAYPGHHLQGMWFVRSASPLRLLLAQASETREGWAFYCEERVREMGFEDMPATRFMTTMDQLLRAARVVMDVKLSTGRMGYQEGIEFLIDTVGMDRVAAEAELRRYIATPGYQLSYFWGKERIRELKKWAKEKMRSRFSESFFHHALLRAGPLPIKLLRHELDWRIEEELKKPVPAEKKPEATEKPSKAAARAAESKTATRQPAPGIRRAKKPEAHPRRAKAAPRHARPRPSKRQTRRPAPPRRAARHRSSRKKSRTSRR